ALRVDIRSKAVGRKREVIASAARPIDERTGLERTRVTTPNPALFKEGHAHARAMRVVEDGAGRLDQEAAEAELHAVAARLIERMREVPTHDREEARRVGLTRAVEHRDVGRRLRRERTTQERLQCVVLTARNRDEQLVELNRARAVMPI